MLRPEGKPGAAKAWVHVAVSRLRNWLGKATDQAMTVSTRTDGYLLEAVLPAQALRRAGEPRRARDVLAAALSQAMRRTHLRTRICLPVPLGFSDAPAVLGFDEGDPGTPDPSWVWHAGGAAERDRPGATLVRGPLAG